MIPAAALRRFCQNLLPHALAREPTLLLFRPRCSFLPRWRLATESWPFTPQNGVPLWTVAAPLE